MSKRIGWKDVLAAAPERGRVLVVDDEVEVRRGLQRLINRFGYTVSVAASAEEADFLRLALRDALAVRRVLVERNDLAGG